MERARHYNFPLLTLNLPHPSDGQRVPLKADTAADRREGKAEHLEAGLKAEKEAGQLFRRHDKLGSDRKWDEAREHFKCCISITSDMVQKTIIALKQMVPPVEFIVAPFEADAQIAALCMSGYAALAITEDSDLVVYSITTERHFPILFKLDREGQCEELAMTSLKHVGECAQVR